MWISRLDHDRLVSELAAAKDAARWMRGQVDAAQDNKISHADYDRIVSELATSKATLEWMRVQVNTAQAEKASLLSALTKTPVMTPTIREAGASPIAPSFGPGTTPDSFSAQLAAMFEDVGDDAATALRIDHDAMGAIVYR